jgi:outer membrane protein TolC
LKSSEISLKALKRANMATISATTNMGLSNESIHLFNRNGTRSQSVGVSVSIPIFTGFNLTYSEHAAEKSLEAQRNSLINTERNVEKDVWNSWHNYETAKTSWITTQDQIATATQLKEVALGRYREGLGSILDVLNAQLQYSNALQSQLQTRYNLLTTRVDLVRSVGVLDLESMNPESTLDTASAKTDTNN